MSNPRIKESYHAARWQEPIIFELGTKGERGVLPPPVENEITDEVNDPCSNIPEYLIRSELAALPELSQPQVLRHFLRLSQETVGAAVAIDLLGTCTMKYNPVINDVVASDHRILEVHPLQPYSLNQGLYSILFNLQKMLGEISGMDAFSLQPAAGAPAIFVNASIIRAYHKLNGEGDSRNEIITTVFSHPADAATAAAAGFKVITLYPDEFGYPEPEALHAALSERTAGLMITNPEDTGIFNPHIREFTDAVHRVGGLCAIDQANANGTLGIVRAREFGFDLCHFNLHKSFSTPHGSEGPAGGAVGVTDELEKFLPYPVVSFDGEKYWLDYNRPQSIGKIKGFIGNVGIAIRAYAWIMAHGAKGLDAVAKTSVMNNNYLMSLISDVQGLSIPYGTEGGYRLQEVRYSWNELFEDTGVGTNDIKNRMVDFGVNNYFTSHTPWLIPEPFTIEPPESYSKQELEEYSEIIRKVAEEAYNDPEMVKGAPYKSSISHMDESAFVDPEKVFTTWRAWLNRESLTG